MNGARSIYQEEIYPEYKPPVKQPLTKKEQAIFDLIIQGKKSKEMAEILDVSVYTINNHRKNILRKQQCRSLQQLLAGV
jgi:DNA-binding CsgD family transcriptional regulator